MERAAIYEWERANRLEAALREIKSIATAAFSAEVWKIANDALAAEEPFLEIDSAEFEEAKRDPTIKAFARYADALLARMRREGRVS